jgi:hypothetical protein
MRWVGQVAHGEFWLVSLKVCGYIRHIDIHGKILTWILEKLYIRYGTGTYGESRDSSVGIALGYGLDDRGSRVRFPAGAGNFSLLYRVQNVSGAHPTSYPMGTRGSFPGGEAAGA